MPQGFPDGRAAFSNRERPDASLERGIDLRAGRDDGTGSAKSRWRGHAEEASGGMPVTDPTTRLLQTFSLPAFDFTPEETRLVKGAAVTAAVVLWFSAALIDAWFLLLVPLVAAMCTLAIWRLRRGQPEGEEPDDDWSF